MPQDGDRETGDGDPLCGIRDPQNGDRDPKVSLYGNEKTPIWGHNL